MKVVAMVALLAVGAVPVLHGKPAGRAGAAVSGASASLVFTLPAAAADPIKKCMPHCSGG